MVSNSISNLQCAVRPRFVRITLSPAFAMHHGSTRVFARTLEPEIFEPARCAVVSTQLHTVEGVGHVSVWPLHTSTITRNARFVDEGPHRESVIRVMETGAAVSARLIVNVEHAVLRGVVASITV